MAEIGTIASVLQLVELGLKLRRLCSEIRSAPSELKDLVEEVVILSEMLQDIGSMEAANGAASSYGEPWKKCYRLFENSTTIMAKLVTDLEDTSKLHKLTGNIRVWLRKEELNKYKDRLERCKSTMNLALQFYSQTTLRQQHSVLVHQIQTLASQQQTHSTIAQVDQSRRNDCCQNIVRYGSSSDWHESVVLYNTKPALTRQNHSRVTYRLGFPTWLLRASIHIICERRVNSVGMTLRVYHQVSNTAPVITAAESDDWTTVRALISDRKASLFDQDSSGWTLLHHAANLSNHDACKFLLDAGLDPSYFSTLHPVWPHQNIYWAFDKPDADGPMSASYDTFFLLLAACPEVFEFPEDELGQMQFARHPPGPLHKLQEMMDPPYDSCEPLIRAKMAMNTDGLYSQNVYDLLGTDLTLTSAFEMFIESESLENHITLMRNAIWPPLYYKNFDGDYVRGIRRGWESIMSAIIDFERANTGSYWFTSLYFCYVTLNHNLYRRHELYTLISDDISAYLTSLGRGFLEFLQSCGVDLDRYGRVEKLALHQNRHSRRIPLYETLKKPDHCASFRYITVYCVSPRYLTTGPNVDDWKVYVVPCSTKDVYWDEDNKLVTYIAGHDEYEMAGAFWHWIENPEFFGIPGSYVEEEEDGDYADEQPV